MFAFRFKKCYKISLKEFTYSMMPAVHSRWVHLVSLGRELPETRLGECNSTLLLRALNFGVRHEATAGRDTRPFDSCITDHKKSETLTRRDTSAETIREDPRQGKCSHVHSHSCLVSGSLGESVQPAWEYFEKKWKIFYLIHFEKIWTNNDKYFEEIFTNLKKLREKKGRIV